MGEFGVYGEEQSKIVRHKRDGKGGQMLLFYEVFGHLTQQH